MESSLEKFSGAVQAFSTYGIYLVAAIFGSLGLINSLGTELLPAVSILYVVFLAIAFVATRGRVISNLRAKPLKALLQLGVTYLAVFVNQWAFVNLEAYLSICVLAGILAVIPYIFRMAIAVDRYRLGAEA